MLTTLLMAAEGTVEPRFKADTHEVLRVYQRFHGCTSSSGAEFPPRKMLHDIQPVKYLGASSRGKLSELENAPSCVLTRAK